MKFKEKDEAYKNIIKRIEHKNNIFFYIMITAILLNITLHVLTGIIYLFVLLAFFGCLAFMAKFLIDLYKIKKELDALEKEPLDDK